tara:strand:+ start:813 stop:2747 length:1935 start_codon:yes stop_codon:yes gene_type:complete
MSEYKYTIDFVLSHKNTFNNDKYNEFDNDKYYDLKNFLLIYQKINDKIEFKKKKYKNQNTFNLNNRKKYNKNNKYQSNNTYKKKNNEWRLSSYKKNNNKSIVKLKKGDNAWTSHSLNDTKNEESNLIKYKKIILGNLNKITDKNIDKIIAILSNKLIDCNDILSFYLLADELIKKIWFDNSFYEQYVKIIKHFSNLSEEWYSNLFLIYNNSDGDFYWKYINYDDEYSKYTTNIKGGFQSREDALKNALLKSNFKTIFLDVCYREFNKKNDYINEIEDLIIQQSMESENNELEKDDIDLKIFKLKRKVVGTVEIIAYLLKNTDFRCSNDIFHIICVDILNNIICSNKSDKMKHIIEAIVKNMNSNTNESDLDLDLVRKNNYSNKNAILIDTFIKLWYIVCNRDRNSGNSNKSKLLFRRDNNNFINDKMTVILYIKLLKIAINNNKWKTKIRFVLQDYCEFISNLYNLNNNCDINELKQLLQDENNTDSNTNDNNSDYETKYEYDDDDFYNFKDLIGTKISSYSKKYNECVMNNNKAGIDIQYDKIYEYIENLLPGNCSFMGDELYSKYIEELVLNIIMRCFDYIKEEEIMIDGLLKRLIDDKLVNNKHILNTYKLIEEYWDDFIIDFPKMGEYMTSIKSRLALNN